MNDNIDAMETSKGHNGIIACIRSHLLQVRHYKGINKQKYMYKQIRYQLEKYM